MPAANASSFTQPKINPRFLPAVDKVLITGLRLGDEGKHQAINKVLQLVPEWRRGDCWRRIRQLRRSSLVPHLWLRAEQEHTVELSQRHSFPRTNRLWTKQDDAKLLDWAGYEPVSKIARRLQRSVRAVRFRLGALGMSARVSDGWSQRELRGLLRVSPIKLRRWIGTGLLRVRDPRVTTESLLSLCTHDHPSFDPTALDRITAAARTHDALSWDRAAELLGVSLDQLQVFISQGGLKVRDPFITDRSFEEFCRKHGDQINMALIDPATTNWLQAEYAVSDGNVRSISRAQKHALVVRVCRCGRKIAGNIYFKHVRHCSIVHLYVQGGSRASVRGETRALNSAPTSTINETRYIDVSNAMPTR